MAGQVNGGGIVHVTLAYGLAIQIHTTRVTAAANPHLRTSGVAGLEHRCQNTPPLV
jgi:hypothetical protein